MTRTRLAAMLLGSSLCVLTGVPMFAQATQRSVPNQGAQLFASNCAYCHGADGKGGRGPAIATMPKVIAFSDSDLARIVHDGEVDQGMPAFPDLGVQGIQAVVRYLRTLQGVTGAAHPARLTGDPNAGREIFFGAGKCSTCHMVKGKGGFIAPDLTAYAQGHTAGDILQAIVNPDAHIQPTSRVVEVRTSAGQSLKGVVRAEDNMNITLQTEDGRYHFLSRSSLASIDYTGHSLMPRDYGTRFTPAKLNDLVSFLIVTGKSAPAAPAPVKHSWRDGN